MIKKKLIEWLLSDELKTMRKELKDLEDLCVRNSKCLNELMRGRGSLERRPLPVRKVGRPPKN